MRKVPIVVAAVVAVLLAAVLLGPGLVDWNAYKGRIAQAAYDATGRRLTIDGDISLSVLPAPKLVVRGVRLANVAGGAAPDMARLKSLDVRVSLPALLRGKIQVRSVTLVEPVVSLELWIAYICLYVATALTLWSMFRYLRAAAPQFTGRG